MGEMRETPREIFARYSRKGGSHDSEDSFAWQLKHLAGDSVPPCEREVALIAGRRFRFDFVWRDAKIVLEIEGGIWRKGGGAHSHPLNILRDIEKYNALALLGYRLFRVTTDQVKNHQALELVQRLFA